MAKGYGFGPASDKGKAVDKPKKKSLRTISVRQSQDGQWYFVAQDRKREDLYTSETYPHKATAIRRAKREHSSSDDFSYVLEYHDKDGNLVRETLN